MTTKSKGAQADRGNAKDTAELCVFFQLALREQRGREALRYKRKSQH